MSTDIREWPRDPTPDPATVQPHQAPVTKEQWQQIEQCLSAPYNSVRLLVDGFRVSIHAMMIKHRLALVVFVDGVIKTEWLFSGCEQRQRFYRPFTRKLFSEKEWTQLHGRKTKKRPPIKEVTHYSTHWLSPRSLTRHLRANNKVISLEFMS